MNGRYTRREAMAAVGGLAVAGELAIAGCLGEDRYWDDPPAFDPGGLGSVTDRPLPERPDVVPPSVGWARRVGDTERVADLLGTVPEPLTAAVLPNGTIREAIVEERETARGALEAAGGTRTTVERVRNLVAAREGAAAAAGTWAATRTRTPYEETLAGTEVDEVERLGAERPYAAPDPETGCVVYGTFEDWGPDDGASQLRGGSARTEPNQVRAGRKIGEIERRRAKYDAYRHLHGRYVDSITDPRDVEQALRSAAAELAPRTRRRYERLHEDEPEHPFRYPGVDPLLDDDVRRDSPGGLLLRRKLSKLVRSRWVGTIAWPGTETSRPALAVRNTHRVYARFEGVHALVERLNDGDDLFPPDADAVRTARREAIDRVANLGGSTAPLDRWTARRLVAAFDRPDGVIRTVEEARSRNDGETPSEDAVARYAARAHAEYVWIGLVARLAPDATAPVADALGR